QVDLIIRGICCLRPGVPGLSERIRVLSIVDRYLEHARVFCFENSGARELLLSSSDWMPRNLDHRVEVAFPLLDTELQRNVLEVLEVQLSDTVKGREISSDGRSHRVERGAIPIRSQERLYHLSGPEGRISVVRPAAASAR